MSTNSTNINSFFADDDEYVDIFGDNENKLKKDGEDNGYNYSSEQNTDNDIYSHSKSENNNKKAETDNSNDSYYDEDSEYDDDGYYEEEYENDFTPLWYKIIMILLYSIIIIFAFVGILTLSLPQVRTELFSTLF